MAEISFVVPLSLLLLLLLLLLRWRPTLAELSLKRDRPLSFALSEREGRRGRREVGTRKLSEISNCYDVTGNFLGVQLPRCRINDASAACC